MQGTQEQNQTGKTEQSFSVAFALRAVVLGRLLQNLTVVVKNLFSS